MTRGTDFEERVGSLLTGLQSNYGEQVQLQPQLRVGLASGRFVVIDFKLTVDFPHEVQSYYFELQSRNKHDHGLADKVEAIRRDTPLSTFSFVHESPLEPSVEMELRSRNIVPKDWDGLVRFVEGIELQLLQQVSAVRVAKGQRAHDETSESRLKELVQRLADAHNKDTRQFRPTRSQAADGLINEIVEEVKRNPDEAIRLARRFFES